MYTPKTYAEQANPRDKKAKLAPSYDNLQESMLDPLKFKDQFRPVIGDNTT